MVVPMNMLDLYPLVSHLLYLSLSLPLSLSLCFSLLSYRLPPTHLPHEVLEKRAKGLNLFRFDVTLPQATT